MTQIRKMLMLSLVLMFGLMLSGCGGGGDDNSNATGNQWDQMSWDQGKWG